MLCTSGFVDDAMFPHNNGRVAHYVGLLKAMSQKRCNLRSLLQLLTNRKS